MITAYHRPKTLEEALSLLAQANTLPLGGGTWINSPAFRNRDAAVVDLQALGLTHIRKHGHALEIDACVTLESLRENAHAPDALRQAIHLEAPLNLRNSATVAGALVTCGGRSTFAAMMLALDARLTVLDENGTAASLSLGEYLPLRQLPGKLITRITIPLNVQTAFAYVARTPSDLPLVCAALARWNSGRTRLALGGYGQAPTLAMDGTEADGLEPAARNAYHEAADDLASAEYRRDVATVLTHRCFEAVENRQ
ncbi:MAG: FAD binding domain-containing protein [Anaerolineales bacterium]